MSTTVVTKYYLTSYKPSVDYLHSWVNKDLEKADFCDDPDLVLKYFLQLASKHSEFLDLPSGKTLLDRCLNTVFSNCNRHISQDKKSLSTKVKIALER